MTITNDIVTAMPLLGEWHCDRNLGTNKPLYPLNSEDLTTWYCGRTAIYQAIKALTLNENDIVLIPAYGCGSEADSVLKAGVKIEFYHVKENLIPDFHHIEKLCQTKINVKAVLAINYFGFPLPMSTLKGLANKYQLAVIEDNAHGFLSRNEIGDDLGSLGDIGIFSFVKSLPLPDGGGLIFNNKDLAKTLPSQLQLSNKPEFISVLGKMKYLYEQLLMARFPRGMRVFKAYILGPLVRCLKIALRKGEKNQAIDKHSVSQEEGYASVKEHLNLIELKPKHQNWRMSTLAERLLREKHYNGIVSVRRQNYSYMLNHLPQSNLVKPLLPELPENCCPLLFPIYCLKPASLYNHLASRKVSCKRFWSFFHPALPVDKFPTEANLKNYVLALPIFQGMTQFKLSKVITVIEEWQQLIKDQKQNNINVTGVN